MSIHLKQFKTLILILALMLTAAMVQGRTTYPRGGSRGGGKNGTHGTITSVGTRGFILTLDASKSSTSSTGATTLKIVCDRNTKFMRGGSAVDPSEIKEGLIVSVAGSVLGADEMQASMVMIDGADKPKAKKKT